METKGSLPHSQLPDTCSYPIIRWKYWTLCTKTWVCFVVAGNIKSP